jgi:uncharacterized protein
MEFLNLNNAPSIQVEVIEDISKINPEDWNACVCADAPFARHEFLSALEDSQCVQPKNGWMAHHLVIKGTDGKIKACAPMYLKGHSYGEYVFDWAWADAYERAGGKYYPKLQSAIPFTPVTGPRFLLHPDASAEDRSALISAMIKRAVDLKVSSLHVTFSTRDEWDLLKDHGFLQRTGHQYHWENKGYSDFNGFLNELSSRKRKTIRKERKTVAESGVKLVTLSGDEIQEHHWDAFFAFYIDTSGRKWGQAYLNREFFSLLGQRMGQDIVLILAQFEDRIVAGALNIKGNKTLYGRYWGCLEDFRFLHFETCYYQAIDYAIAHKLKRVEAGAQGEHKIQRGYLPVETYSAHWIADKGFARAVDDFLEHDKRVNTHQMNELSTLSPYKKE